MLSVCENGTKKSLDEGKTWSTPVFVCNGLRPDWCQILKTKNGTLIILYLKFDTYKFLWNSEKSEPEDDCKLELWCTRSTDNGNTWIDNHMVIDGYDAEFFGFVQTRTGRVVASVEHLATKPGRWVSFSIYSDDEDKIWKKSNIIDIGRCGHHSGAMEPTVAELNNGKLLMLIRTNLDWFWQAFSEDDGKTWLKPVVIAKQKGHISYPYIFERSPGELWVTALWLKEPDGSNSKIPLRVKLQEDQFLKMMERWKGLQK
ncbi:MAG: glycoside hydrolase [bacterium]|nr:glycoside hydrolase [bacterium]